MCARLRSAVSEETGGGDAHKNTRSATTAKAALMNIHRVADASGLSHGYFIFNRSAFSESAGCDERTSAGVINIHEAGLRDSTGGHSRVENY